MAERVEMLRRRGKVLGEAARLLAAEDLPEMAAMVRERAGQAVRELKAIEEREAAERRRGEMEERRHAEAERHEQRDTRGATPEQLYRRVLEALVRDGGEADAELFQEIEQIMGEAARLLAAEDLPEMAAMLRERAGQATRELRAIEEREAAERRRGEMEERRHAEGERHERREMPVLPQPGLRELAGVQERLHHRLVEELTDHQEELHHHLLEELAEHQEELHHDLLEEMAERQERLAHQVEKLNVQVMELRKELGALRKELAPRKQL
jgi:hypothetical protein